MLDRIENLSDKNPKEFWKLVNSIKLHQSSAKTSEIQASEWLNYFENLNGIHLKTDKDIAMKLKLSTIMIDRQFQRAIHLIGQLHLKRSLHNKKN